MTEKEMRRLSRAELLELLLEQTEESERLKKRLEEVEAQLSDRRIRVDNAGDLASAVLAVNGVVEAAQAAAQQYLDNIRNMEAEVMEGCRHRLQNRTDTAATEELPVGDPLAADVDDLLLADLRDFLDDDQM